MKYVIIAVLLVGCSDLQQKHVIGPKEPAKVIDTAAMRLEILELAKPAYIKAFKEVEIIRSYIRLADSGSISKSLVLRRYNETVGSQMGLKATFNEMKKHIERSGNDFAKMKWYQAAAEIASEKAAEKSVEAELIRQSSK